ncbi:hypothetical protein EJB05_29824, partial [Eragrostis curvula]
MLKKLLPKTKSKKKEAASSALPTLDRLHETLEMLEKKERFLQKKSSAEIEKAKDYIKAKNKNVVHGTIAENMDFMQRRNEKKAATEKKCYESKSFVKG